MFCILFHYPFRDAVLDKLLVPDLAALAPLADPGLAGEQVWGSSRKSELET
jgi:hypothetical protein